MPDGPGLTAGLMIHRHTDMKGWKAAVDALPEEQREEAVSYLSGISARYRVLVKMARDCGCASFDEFEEVKLLAKKAGAPGAVAWSLAGRPDHWRYGVDSGSQAWYNHRRRPS